MASTARCRESGSRPVDPATDPTTDRIDARTWTIAAIVTLGGIMSSIDTTVVNVALETLARDFGASLTGVQWVSTGYLLALVAVIPLAGWASDRFGAKRLWIASVVLFLAGSMLAGAAWSLGSLIVFRILQGLGGGMIVPVGMTLLSRTAGPSRMGRVMAILGVQQLLGPVLGPVIGGALVEHAGWRWIFYVNVPIGALAIPLAARLLPRDATQPRKRFDGVGFLLISPGVAALIYGLTQSAQGGGFTALAFLPILAGIALVAAFVVHARRSKTLIDVDLFRGRAFTAGVGTTFFLGMGLFGALFLLPLYYQGAHGASPLEAGLLMIPQGIGAAIMMPFAGRATDHAGSGAVVLGGLALILAGTVPFALAGSSVSGPLLAAALFVRGLGMGAATMPAMAGVYASLRRGEHGPGRERAQRREALGRLARRRARVGRARGRPARQCRRRQRPDRARAGRGGRLRQDVLVGVRLLRARVRPRRLPPGPAGRGGGPGPAQRSQVPVVPNGSRITRARRRRPRPATGRPPGCFRG